jgi:hypothetical protein
VPEHLREEPRLGVAFLLAVVVLLAIVIAWTFRPVTAAVGLATAVVLGALILGYTASRTTGIPVLAPDPESVDAIGIVTVSIEVVGLTCAFWLGQPFRRDRRRPHLKEVFR